MLIKYNESKFKKKWANKDIPSGIRKSISNVGMLHGASDARNLCLARAGCTMVHPYNLRHY